MNSLNNYNENIDSNNTEIQNNKISQNSSQKIIDFILEKIFFIIGAFLLLIGIGYSIIEFIKDIKILLLLVFILGLIFIILPYRYKEKLSNFFFIGLQAIGITILYTNTIVSSLLFNIFPLIYSLIIVFGISLLSLILSLKNKSSVLMVLSSAGAYLSIVFPDIPLNLYINKYLLFITLINAFMSVSFNIFKWLEMRIINLLFFILSVIIFFSLKGLSTEYTLSLIIFLSINYFLFYFNFIILSPKLSIIDSIYFIILNLIYWTTSVFLIKSYEFSIYFQGINSNVISFIYSLLFTIFLAANYYIYNQKKENENIFWVFYSMIILFLSLTIQTLLNNIYWFTIWLTLSTVYLYIYSLNKNEEYKSLAISAYIMFFINFILFLIYYWSLDYTRIFYLIITFILMTILTFILSKLDQEENIAKLKNIKYFPIFLISLILPFLFMYKFSIKINYDIHLIIPLLSVFNILIFTFLISYYFYILSNSLIFSIVLGIIGGLPLACTLFWFLFYLLGGNNIALIIITTLNTILLILIVFNVKINNLLTSLFNNEKDAIDSKIFNMFSTNINTLILISLILPPIEIIKSQIILIDKFYLMITVYGILSIVSLFFYINKPNLLKSFSYYSIIIFYILIVVFLLHLLYPLFNFYSYHSIYSDNNFPFFNLRTISYITLIICAIIFYYIYKNNYSLLKDNSYFNNIDRNSILITTFIFIILVIQEIYDISFRINLNEFLPNLIVLIIISIYGTLLLFLANKEEKFKYLKDAALISFSLAIIITSRSYFRHIDYFQVLLVIMGIYFILFAILYNPKKIKEKNN